MFYLHKREFDYAIRICAYLAGLPSNHIISVSSLSKKLLITRAFATKIIYNLRQENIIGSVQGKNGGVFLKKDPNKLNLKDILFSVGLTKKLSDCINEDNFCPLTAPCKIHSFFMELEDDVLKKLLKKNISEFRFNDNNIKTIINNKMD